MGLNKTNLLILFLFFFSFSNAQGTDTIYGKVKSIREELKFINDSIQNKKLFSNEGDYGHYGFYSAEFTVSRFKDWWYNTDFVHYINYYKEFDRNEKLLKEIWFYKNQDTANYNAYKYTNSGKVKNHKKISYKESNSNYTYDQNDNLIIVKTIYSDSSYRTKKYKYNSQNLVSEYQYFDSEDPKDIRTTEKYYNSLGSLIKIRNLEDGDDYSEENGTVFKYDEQDKLIEYYSYEHEFDENKDVVFDRVKIKYIDDLLTEHLSCDENDSITYFRKYDYDEKKRIIKEVSGRPKYPDVNEILEYKYANHDLPVKLVCTGKEKRTVIDFEHEFDENNNWIKQTKIVNGKRLFVWTRRIEYYKE